VKQVIQYFFDNLANNTDSLNAIILDLRNNRGGDLGDLNFLVGHLIPEPLLMGYFHTKRNNNPLDYTPWLSIEILPVANSLKKHLPFIILADNYSASLSEAVVMAVRQIPGAIIIGETTYGATGPITGNEVYNAGSFSVGNFLSVQTSSAAFKYADNKSYEGKGFPPDIFIPFSEDSVSLGIDAALNRAIRHMH
jgi:C-terminal processing protease CtpA/Prc